MPLDPAQPKKSSWMAKAFGDDNKGPSAPTGPKPPAPASSASAPAEAVRPSDAPEAPSTPPGAASERSEQPEAPKSPPARKAPAASKRRARTSPAAAVPPAASAKPAATTGDAFTAPPFGAKQPERFQCRISTVVSENVSQTEQLIAARAEGMSLNTIREIAVWWALGDPNNVDRFITEALPAWFEARNQATLRASQDVRGLA